MHRIVIALAAFALTVVSAREAATQTGPAPSEAMKAMVGGWEMSNADRDKTCTVTFKLDAAGPGRVLDLDKNCGVTFPVIKDAAVWTRAKDDALQLMDAKGKLLLTFDEVESGLFESAHGGDSLYFLQALAALEGRTADQMFGDWAFTRANGRPICQITLMSEAASADGFAIKLKPGCDSLITDFGPRLWRMDHGQLVVVSARGDIWRLEEGDQVTWRRIPEGRTPLLLVRQ